jgi:hypothetical protein
MDPETKRAVTRSGHGGRWAAMQPPRGGFGCSRTPGWPLERLGHHFWRVPKGYPGGKPAW